MDSRSIEYYARYEQAREIERQGDLERALTIYLDIIKYCSPEGTVYYERPAIILEKLGKYKEAIRVCERAIKKINNVTFHADPQEFQKRIDRLNKKIRKGGACSEIT